MNVGQMERTMIQGHHPAIVRVELFRKVSPKIMEDIYEVVPENYEV